MKHEREVFGMTRWDIFKELMMSRDTRKAVGKAWPLFLFIIFEAGRSNKLNIGYPELKEKLNESVNTIMKWRRFLEENKVISVTRGKYSIMFCLRSPYKSLVTCEQDDVARIQLKSDPTTRKIVDKLSSYGNMSLLPIIAELTYKIEEIQKKIA